MSFDDIIQLIILYLLYVTQKNLSTLQMYYKIHKNSVRMLFFFLIILSLQMKKPQQRKDK